MSSKRSAGFQLTRFEHEAERPGVEIEESQQASQDVMSRRKIAPRPKARTAGQAPAAANPFGSFGAAPAAAPATQAAPANPNPFASFNTSTPAPVKAPTQQASQQQASTPGKLSRKQFIGLNSKFAQTISHYLEVNPGGSWEAACEKYLAYVKNFSAPASTASTPAPLQKPQASTGSSSSSDSKSGPVQFNPPAKFTFGGPSTQSSGGPVKFEPPKSFTFGGQQPKSKDEAPKPAEPKEEAPKFQFSSEAPKFQFGKSNNDAGASKPFQFGSTTPNAPQLNFGAPKPSTGGEGQNLMFGANSAPAKLDTPEAPKFTFGSTSSDSSKPFSFGANSATSSASDAAASAPKFSFGGNSSGGSNGSNGTSEAPKFNFGNTNTEAPKFSFGQPTNSSANVNSTWKPSEKPAEPQQDDEDAAPAEPQQDFTGKGAGEENEDSVFEVRTKLYEANNDVYGLGTLRVLVHHETKKARIVVRADGAGRVLINTSVQKAFNYTATKNFVTIPVFGGEKPVSYRARVKTEASAKELADKLNEVA